MESQKQPVKTEAFFDLPFPRERVWPVLSKTDWLNRSAGLPPVSYTMERLPEGGTRVWASAKMFGLLFRWEEKPFEWIEPEFYRVERVFPRGPIERIRGGIEFQSGNGATRLRIFSEVLPRDNRGVVIAKFLLGPKATRGMGNIVEHVHSFLNGREQVAMPKLARTEVNERSFETAIQRLRSYRADESLTGKLEAFVRESADVELARIRPFAVARQWGADRWEVLRIFLFGTRAGLLDLSWEVLCPNCRSTREPLATALADLKTTAHCEVCQIEFDAEFDKSVELKFTVNPAIKRCPQQTFCLAGPGGKPHVIAQLLVAPKSAKGVSLGKVEESIRVRSPQVTGIGRGVRPGTRVTCAKVGFQMEQGGHEQIEFSNPNEHSVQVVIENTEWSEDILTAARATNLQEFRDLFAQQVVSPREQIVVGQQIILFTDLRGSTAMYCGIGDASAYALVRDHFAVLREAIGRYRGAIVKTIGDAVMGVFSDAGEALEAVREMHLKLDGVRIGPDQPALQLKSGLHLGPCLAVNANERLDYFGTTVNLAARLVDCCQGGDVTLSDDFYERPETRGFLERYRFSADAAEMRFRGFEAVRKIWRVDILPRQGLEREVAIAEAAQDALSKEADQRSLNENGAEDASSDAAE